MCFCLIIHNVSHVVCHLITTIVVGFYFVFVWQCFSGTYQQETAFRGIWKFVEKAIHWFMNKTLPIRLSDQINYNRGGHTNVHPHVQTHPLTGLAACSDKIHHVC